MEEGSSNASGETNASDRGEPGRLDAVGGSQQQLGPAQSLPRNIEEHSTQKQHKEEEHDGQNPKKSLAHFEHDNLDSDSQWESEGIEDISKEAHSKPRKRAVGRKEAQRSKRRKPTIKVRTRDYSNHLRNSRNPSESLERTKTFSKSDDYLEWMKRELHRSQAEQKKIKERLDRLRLDHIRHELLEEQEQSNRHESTPRIVEESRNDNFNEPSEPMGDAEFRDRVRRRFGHSVEELRSLLEEHAEEEENVNFNEKETWTKVNRKYLLPDTLMAYGLPWEWDQENPDFIIIRKYLSPSFSEELFDHTRKIRARHTTLSTMNNTDYRSRHSTFASRRFSSISEEIPHRSSPTIEVEEEGEYEEYDEPEYQPPECEETGEPLSFDVNMKRRAIRNPANDLLRQNNPGVNGVEISSSRISGHGKIDLYRKDITMDSQSTQMSWIHMEKEARTFDEFVKFASQAPGLLQDDTVLIWKLLDKARTGLRPAHDGGHLEHFVIRSVGRDPSGLDKSVEQKSAIFMCFPFFSIESINKLARKAGNVSVLQTRGLLQTYYHLEATRQRDLEQAVRKTGQYPKHHIIHVPQLWAVVFSSRLLITCSSLSFANAGAHSLNILDPPKSQSQSVPSIIRLTDHLQRVFFVPMEHCRTWFALMDRIKNHCLSDVNFSGHDCQLFTPDNKLVKSGDWQAITTNHTSTILRLDIRLVILEAPETTRFSNQRSTRHYTPYRDTDDLSLDEDDPRNFVRQRRSMALVKRAPTWSREKETEAALILHGGPKRLRLNKTSSDVAQSRIEDGTPLNRAVKRPVPPASGIIVNVEPSSNLEGPSSIYFMPNKISDRQSGVAVSQGRTIPPPKDILKTMPQHTTQTSKDENNRDLTTLGSLPNHTAQQNQDVQADPSSSNEDQIRVNIPPVFTWATGKKSNPDVGPEPGIPTENGHSLEESDVAVGEEETLIYVCDYIHAQLDEAGESAYEGVLPHSLRATEEVVQQLFNSSVSDLTRYTTTTSSPEDVAVLPPWKSSLRRAAGSLLRFLGFFLPMDYRCEVGDKYLGAVLELLIVLSQLCSVSQSYDTVNQPREEFEIVDISDPNDVDLQGPKDIEMLKTPISACIKCYESDKYSTRQAALDHLKSRHFRSALPIPDVNSYWIMGYEQRLNLCCRRDAEKIISLLLDHCDEFEKMVSEIQHGVSENGKFDRDTYRIPPCLVDSFKYLLMMVIYGSELAKSVLRNRERHRGSEIPLTFFNQSYQQQLVTFGAMAEGSMENAKEQILRMAITDDTFDIGGYHAVSPEFILLTLMEDTRSRDGANKKVNLIMIYLNYMRRLQFKVSQNPHHRLLRDLRFVIEELDIIRNIIQKQRLLFANYRNLLDPSSFRVTTESRKSAFAVEENKLEKFITDLDYDMDIIDHLIKRAESLARQTQSGVEVRQEDHGKAILVFTIVTVVFLPLSFVTSYLGMNTVDIRDMGSNQTLFWAIAVPVAVVIITFSLVIGFKADEIREVLLTQPWTNKRGKLSRAIHDVSDIDLYNVSVSTISSKSHRSRQGWFRQHKDKAGITETIQQVV